MTSNHANHTPFDGTRPVSTAPASGTPPTRPLPRPTDGRRHRRGQHAETPPGAPNVYARPAEPASRESSAQPQPQPWRLMGRAGRVQPVRDRFRTSMCRHFERHGACSFGAQCNFAHHASELRTAKSIRTAPQASATATPPHRPSDTPPNVKRTPPDATGAPPEGKGTPPSKESPTPPSATRSAASAPRSAQREPLSARAMAPLVVQNTKRPRPFQHAPYSAQPRPEPNEEPSEFLPDDGPDAASA